MRVLTVIYLGITLAIAVSVPAGAAVEEEAEAPKEPKEEAYHVEADVTEGYYTAGEQVLHGIGNVVIVHGETTITCDEAYSYEAQKLATLLGNVKVRDKVQEYTLTAGYAEYRRGDKLSVATKNPKLVLEKDRPIVITSDIMRMWQGREYGEGAGNVKIVSDDVEGYGQKLKYFGKEDRVELTGKPVVRQADSRLAGDVITLYLEEDRLRRAVAEKSCRLLYFSRPEEEEEEEAAAAAEETSSAIGEAASPEDELASAEEDLAPAEEGSVAGEEMATLGEENADSADEGAPPAEEGAAAAEGEEEDERPTGRVEAAGDRMEGVFTEGKLEQVDVTGEAEGHYWPFDDLGRETGEQIDSAGDLIRITMAGGEVKRILIDGNAEGVYRPAKAEGRSGVTQTAGDTITVFVTKQEIRRIVVSGHARGSYFSEETPAGEAGETSGG
jgi:lipopolysaccharide export system protein LptA